MASTREKQIVWICKNCKEKVNRKESPDPWRFGIGQEKRGCPSNDFDKHEWIRNPSSGDKKTGETL